MTSLDENVDFVVNSVKSPRDEGSAGHAETKAINIHKHHLIASTIASLLQYAPVLAPLVPHATRYQATFALQITRAEPLYSILAEPPYFTATELYYISLDREARAVQTSPS